MMLWSHIANGMIHKATYTGNKEYISSKIRQRNSSETYRMWQNSKENGRHTISTAPSCFALYNIQNLTHHYSNPSDKVTSISSNGYNNVPGAHRKPRNRTGWPKQSSQPSPAKKRYPLKQIQKQHCIWRLAHWKYTWKWRAWRRHNLTMMSDWSRAGYEEWNIKKRSCYLPHDGAHALADTRVPSLGGVQGEAAVRDVVRVMPVPRHACSAIVKP